jgi:ABC-type Na+ efflux pump permease subunit
MRYVNMITCLLMILFIAVQYNDPDGLMWMAIYLVPAIWASIAAFRRQLLPQNVPNSLLLLSIAAAVAATAFYWPEAPRWWTMEVWYESETGREGMGVLIGTIVLLIAWLTGQQQSSAR